MSRHITNSKKNISLLPNLRTNLKNNRKKKEKRSTVIVVIQLVLSFNEPCDVIRLNQQTNEHVMLKAI